MLICNLTDCILDLNYIYDNKNPLLAPTRFDYIGVTDDGNEGLYFSNGSYISCGALLYNFTYGNMLFETIITLDSVDAEQNILGYEDDALALYISIDGEQISITINEYVLNCFYIFRANIDYHLMIFKEYSLYTVVIDGVIVGQLSVDISVGRTSEPSYLFLGASSSNDLTGLSGTLKNTIISYGESIHRARDNLIGSINLNAVNRAPGYNLLPVSGNIEATVVANEISLTLNNNWTIHLTSDLLTDKLDGIDFFNINGYKIKVEQFLHTADYFYGSTTSKISFDDGLNDAVTAWNSNIDSSSTESQVLHLPDLFDFYLDDMDTPLYANITESELLILLANNDSIELTVV